MSNETKKSHMRRLNTGDYEKFFTGVGIDIGPGDYPLPVRGVVEFDKRKGFDAHDLSMYANFHFDFVYSSHCLEHLENPYVAIREWWRVLKHGGHMCIVVPEFALYEKRNIPSKYNKDHKTYWTLKSLYQRVVHESGIHGYQVMRLQVNDNGFDYSDKKNDQTTCGAQAEVEIVVKKVIDPFWEDR